MRMPDGRVGVHRETHNFDQSLHQLDACAWSVHRLDSYAWSVHQVDACADQH